MGFVSISESSSNSFDGPPIPNSFFLGLIIQLDSTIFNGTTFDYGPNMSCY